MPPMKLLVVDDHPLIHDALRFLLPRINPNIETLRAETAIDAKRLVGAHPDIGLILLDMSLPDGSGLALLSNLLQTSVCAPIVILSGHVDPETIRQAIGAGAMGYIPKSARAEVMLDALEHVLSGGIYLPPEANYVPGRNIPGREQRRRAIDIGLTDRQSEVLGLLLRGKPTKLICRDLGIAEGTVKIHIAAIFRTLKVNNRTEAVYAANRLGLVLEAAA